MALTLSSPAAESPVVSGLVVSGLVVSSDVMSMVRSGGRHGVSARMRWC